MILHTFCAASFTRYAFARGACPLRQRRSSAAAPTLRRVARPLCQTIQTREPSSRPTTSFDQQMPIELTIDKPQNLMDAFESPDAKTAVVSPRTSIFQGVSPRVKGLILVNVMTLIMSTNFVIVKDAEGSMDPFTFLALRFVIAAVPFIPLLAKTETDAETFYGGVEIGIWSLLGYLTQGVGLLTTDASRVSFLSALTVILVPIIVGLSGRGVSKVVWGSAAMAMVGVSLLSGTGMGESISTGDFLSLASAAFIALQVVRTEYFVRRLSTKQQVSVLGVSMATVAVGASLAALVAHPESLIYGIQHLSWSPHSVIAWMQHIPKEDLFFTGFISTDVVLLIEVMALKDVDSTDAAIVYTMEPVLGALWAYLFLGERWGPTGWVGAALIVGSSFVTQMTGSDSDNKAKDS